MNDTKRKNPVRSMPLVSGQVWHMAESDLHVEDVGKLLVRYKLIRGAAKRTPTSMSPMKAVENFLMENKAVLIQ